MATNKIPTFTMELTFADMSALAELIRDAHRATDYYSKLTDDEVADDVKVSEDGEETVTNNRWKRDQRDSDIAKRARLNALHARLMGGELD